MVDETPGHPEQEGPGGIEAAIARIEKRWLVIVLGIFAVMMIVIVATGIAHALHPPSNVETTDPLRLHLQGEFAESNLGTALGAWQMLMRSPLPAPLDAPDAYYASVTLHSTVMAYVVTTFFAMGFG